MNSEKPSLFPADWPLYAVAAHIGFWVSSLLFAMGIIAAFVNVGTAQIVAFLFFIWIAAALLLGASAVWSGRLYIGNQIFSRTPTTGWPARIAGAFLFTCAGAILLFAYALTQVRAL